MVGERGIIKDSFHTDIKVPLVFMHLIILITLGGHIQGGINKLSHDYARAELAKFDPPTQPVMINGWGESLRQ
jgi:hypothetical protein